MVMVMVRDRARFVELRTYCHISLQSIDGVSPFLPVRTKTSNWKQMGSRVAPQGAVRTRRVRLASEVEFPVKEGNDVEEVLGVLQGWQQCGASVF